MNGLAVQRLKEVGWAPGRKVDITPIEKAYSEVGLTIPEKLRGFFAEFAFLDIEYFDSAKGARESHRIEPAFYFPRESYGHLLAPYGIAGTSYPVGSAYGNYMEIYYHDDGCFYLHMGGGPLLRCGNTADIFLDGLVGGDDSGWEYLSD